MDRRFGHGVMDEQSLPAAIRDFRRARQKALLQRIIGRLTGKSVDLLSYEEVARQLRASARIERGVRHIPLDAIVGSVGRYTDFTRTFLPQKKSDLQRWTSVRTAAADMSQLPPIEVYQIGGAYFVLDGNHRVSIARRQGLKHIDAEVTEVRTRVSLAPEDQPDMLILKAEYAAFLESTSLDQLRPEADLVVSVPGQYTKLENHIEVHRYFVEVAEACELSYEEAVCRWYDDAYLPLVYAIREQGILRYFPGRTEADFYVWLATHRSELQHQFNWRIEPEAAATKLASRIQVRQERQAPNIGRRILDVFVPERTRDSEDEQIFARGRLMARYGDRLFADLLIPLTDDSDGWRALDQAVEVAKRERAHLHGLLATPTETLLGTEKFQWVEEAFVRRCADVGLQGNLAIQAGDPADALCQRVPLSDLVIIDRSYPLSGDDEDADDSRLLSLISRLARPLLLVSGPVVPLERLLLAYDDGPRAREGLFIATYLAEQWQSDLAIVAVHEPTRSTKPTLAHARAYLAMHEIDATFIEERGPAAPALLRTAAEWERDLIVMGTSTSGLFGAWNQAKTMPELLHDWDGQLLICP